MPKPRRLPDNRIGLGIPGDTLRQIPVAEFSHGEWRIWLSYGDDLNAGTYIQLTPNGEAIKHTVDTDGMIVRSVKL